MNNKQFIIEYEKYGVSEEVICSTDSELRKSLRNIINNERAENEAYEWCKNANKGSNFTNQMFKFTIRCNDEMTSSNNTSNQTLDKKVKCINKFRNKYNQITGYRIQDTHGNIKDVTPHQLKRAMSTNKIEVINLTLTSDYRLVDKEQLQSTNKKKKQKYAILTREIVKAINKPKALKFKSNQNIEMLEQKSKILGCGKRISKDFLSIESDTEIILVSDKQIQLSDSTPDYDEVVKFMYYKGLFADTDFTSINFKNTDSSNVSNMANMFSDCEATAIDLSSLDTSRVKNMRTMFYDCKAQTLDLSNFNTSNVKDMSYMFNGCETTMIDISNFKTSKTTDTERMFSRCKAKVEATDTRILNEYLRERSHQIFNNIHI